MGYTKFGEYMRVLRIENHEVMGDVAKMLNVKVSFLSAVENGKKNVPTEWVDKIVGHYSLNEKEKNELLEAIEESKTQYKIVASNSGNNQRKAALQFARSFEGMDDETAIKILNLLNKKKGCE